MNISKSKLILIFKVLVLTADSLLDARVNLGGLIGCESEIVVILEIVNVYKSKKVSLK